MVPLNDVLLSLFTPSLRKSPDAQERHLFGACLVWGPRNMEG